MPSALPQQRPSTIAPAKPVVSPAPAKGKRVTAASVAQGRPVVDPAPTRLPAARDELKPVRAAPRTVKTSTFYPLTPKSEQPEYTPQPLDPKTPPAGRSAKARASGIPELGGWEQKGEERYHLASHKLDLVKVEGGWWWAKTGGPPISIGTGYPFSSPTQAVSCLQRRYLNTLGWKSGPWAAFAASRGLT